MEEKIALYGLAALSILIAAGLLVFRTYVISKLSDEKIESILGKRPDSTIEVTWLQKTIVKMRSPYPSLFFLVPAILLPILAFRVEIAKEEWLVEGNFVLSEEGVAQPNWREGIMTLFPSDLKQNSVGENGEFSIRVDIPSGTTFEEAFEFIVYSTFDKTHSVRFSPTEELTRHQGSGDGTSLLTDMGPKSRFYDQIPVRVLPTVVVDGG